ncbi:hypothetical protein Sme01_60320 [Sphaerisporangium melleum]|uniref:Uncharacterized protein n=1 Tax=Sphaerisporangium melleum TaxID=321316 RepID=A0A917RBE0_9ACTN|nr:hypothetical protein [Sphaerisporangium melleum]GGK99103.1 hypothetical protein GCM10007964_46510 [Sphaerisporangium melleum]GII73556.1 hypothetical protein Sme01_60320 [Sphaerisporangium melleum]
MGTAGRLGGKVFASEAVRVHASLFFSGFAVEQAKGSTEHIGGGLAFTPVGGDHPFVVIAGTGASPHVPSVHRMPHILGRNR